MNETTYYAHSGIKVTDNHLAIKNQIYPLADIKIYTFKELKPQRWISYICVIAGLVLLLRESVLFTLGGILLLAGFFTAALGQLKYALVLETTKGQIKALVSEDSSVVLGVIQALDKAMAKYATKIKFDTDSDDNSSTYFSQIPSSLVER